MRRYTPVRTTSTTTTQGPNTLVRHERLSVAMALAESNHHAAPRGQKMARACGVEREENYEPRVLDPLLSHGAATVGYAAAGLPLAVVPSHAGGDGIDDTTVRVLLQLALKKKKRRKQEEAEHERRMQELDRRVSADEQLTPAESFAWRAGPAASPGEEEEEEEEEEKEAP